MPKRDRHKLPYYKFRYIILILGMILFTPLVSNLGLSHAQETRVAVNTIYVDSRRGGDNNQGSRNQPLKTITQALKLAPSGTTISLAGGTYSAETGEVFPLIIRQGITLKGISHGQGQGVIIRGGGSFISPTAAEQNVAIAAIKQASAIEGIMVTNPNSRGHGLWIESASPTVSNSTFTRNGNTGLSVNGRSQPLIQNNYFSNNNGNGLLVYGTSAPVVTDNFFDRTGFGVSIVERAAVTLENNRFQGNRIAMILEGDSQAKLRGNSVANSQESGLVAIARSRVDLGTANDPGNNTFRHNRQHDIQNITSNIISAVGTETNGITKGKLDFSAGAISTLNFASDKPISLSANNSNNFSRLRNNPLPPQQPRHNSSHGSPQEKPIAVNPLPQANPPMRRRTSTETLPPPPAISTPSSETSPTSQTINKELVFSAPDATNSGGIASLSDVLSAPSNRTTRTRTVSTRSIKYRVVVAVNSNRDRQEIIAGYPQAFNTVYQGQSMLQVGAFSDRNLAENTSRSLGDRGFRVYILD